MPSLPPRRLPAAHLPSALALILHGLALLFSPGSWAGADRVELSNGSVIIGAFIDADQGKVKIKTDFAGTLEIDQRLITSMSVHTPVTLQMEDGSLLETQGLQVADQTLTLDQRPEASYALTQLLRINPEPWELGAGYRHTGTASTAFSVQRGNTDLNEFDYRIESRWSGLKDRLTVRLKGESREARGARSAENWAVNAKYDRFQVGDYYWGVAASARQNPFANLDLRATIGPYLGRNLFEDSPFMLEVEAGLSYVSEDFNGLEDRRYVGLTWNLRSESDYFGNDSRLFVHHKGVKNLMESKNLILNTTVGLGFPLIGRLQGAAEVVLNYNSGAVAGTRELDQTYRFRLGYSW